MPTNMQIDESACKQQVYLTKTHEFFRAYGKPLPEPYPYETCQQYVARVEQVAAVLAQQKQAQSAAFQTQISQISESPMVKWYRLAALASSAACAYHGFKRHESSGKGGRNAFLWFLFGGVTPFLALPVAFAQGFAKPKKG